MPNDPQPDQGLDTVDLAILRELQRDGRTSNAQLAARAGVAPSTALTRTRALRDRGVVRGVHADVDPARVGRPLQVLIAVRLHILTRKTLGGLHTDLQGRVLRADGEPLPGLYAAGEAAGFGGGGMHGYRSLEGTFLGGCLFSGRTAGRALAAELR